MESYITHWKLNRINIVVAIIQKLEQIVKTYCKQGITKNASTGNGPISYRERNPGILRLSFATVYLFTARGK